MRTIHVLMGCDACEGKQLGSDYDHVWSDYDHVFCNSCGLTTRPRRRGDECPCGGEFVG